jgi:putative addiction module killer protein
MVSYVVPKTMVEVREFLDRNGHSSFGAWSDHLNREAAAKVAAALARLQQGNFSNAKGVGGAVCEYRVDFGPSYRIYSGKDGYIS